MANLETRGLISPIREVIQRGTPYLGICIGLQILFTESTEFGRTPGLGILEGTVDRFSFDDTQSSTEEAPTRKIPHMGWNSLNMVQEAPLLQGIPQSSYFYFVHSYYVRPSDPEIVASFTEYGIDFASSIWKDNIFACQFHPEKSQAVGLRLLSNFLNLP
jgi:glutamine amidotransferase